MRRGIKDILAQKIKTRKNEDFAKNAMLHRAKKLKLEQDIYKK